MRCSVVTLLHTPHSHMHTPPQEDKSVFCRSQSQCQQREGRGRGGGGAPPEQDGQSVDEYQGPHEGVCVCVRACVCACVRMCARMCVCVMSKKVDTLSSYSTPLGSVCHVRLVPASMSCTVCLCRRSQLVTRPGLSPVLPAPAVSAHLWCQPLPLQRQPQICGLT